MAHADRDPEARSSPKCTGCHTTWGFLEHHASPAPASESRRPPDEVGDLGIACAACHDGHGGEHASGAAPPAGLLRQPEPPAVLLGVPELTHSRSAICLGCHAPDQKSPLPETSAAAIFAGRGGVDPETGAKLAGPAPHLAVAGGCVGCHDAGPAGLERGANHAFLANSKRCLSCHSAALEDGGALLSDARALLARRG